MPSQKVGWGKPPAAGVTASPDDGYGSTSPGRRGAGQRSRPGQVERLVLSTDSGHVVDPEQDVAQVEASVA